MAYDPTKPELLIWPGKRGLKRRIKISRKSFKMGGGHAAHVLTGHPNGTVSFDLAYTVRRDHIRRPYPNLGLEAGFQPRLLDGTFLNPDGTPDETEPEEDGGTPQVETATVVGSITTSGNVLVVVTGAGISGSPKSYNIPVTGGQKQVVEGTVATGPDPEGSGDVDVTVTAAGLTGSPRTIQAEVLGGVKQVETATVDGELTKGGQVKTTVTAAGLTGSPKVILTNVDGTQQVEQGFVNGSIDTGGNAQVIVTADGLPGSPITLNVPVLLGDSQEVVAGKMRAALAANPTITGFFTIGGVDEFIELTKIVATAHDATFNVATQNGTCAGLTTEPLSNHLVAGVEPDTIEEVAEKIRTDLAADEDIADLFDVSGDNEFVVLTKKTAEANDSTLNIRIEDHTSEGINTQTTSENTTAGEPADTADQVAAAVRAALLGDGPIAAFFDISGSGPDVVLTRKTVAANDVTMALDVADGTSTGVTWTPGAGEEGEAGDTAADVAALIRAELAADAAVTALYTVSGAGAQIILTRNEAAANDSSLNISIANGTAAGLTNKPTSANTTKGRAPSTALPTPTPVSEYEYIHDFFLRQIASGEPFVFVDVDGPVLGGMDYSQRSAYLCEIDQDSIDFEQDSEDPLTYHCSLTITQTRGYDPPEWPEIEGFTPPTFVE